MRLSSVVLPEPRNPVRMMTEALESAFGRVRRHRNLRRWVAPLASCKAADHLVMAPTAIQLMIGVCIWPITPPTGSPSFICTLPRTMV